jgi:hypothetical protein
MLPAADLDAPGEPHRHGTRGDRPDAARIGAARARAGVSVDAILAATEAELLIPDEVPEMPIA